MIKYLGSKRLLLPRIVEIVQSKIQHPCTLLDLFSGTARVGHAFKHLGFRILANDHNQYAYTLAQCYIEADQETWQHQAEQLIQELNSIPAKKGYFTHTFCIQSLFFHPKNGERIDAIREEIEKKDLPALLKAIVLTSLLEAADRVDSTCGIQMAYLKKWAKRAENPLHLRLPKLLPRSPIGQSKAYCLDALQAAQALQADIVYIDPPYNQHNYRSNYHIWETLVRWDCPETYGKAAKRTDCKIYKSPFNSKIEFTSALTQVLDALESPYLVISFNNEGFISEQEMEQLLKPRGNFEVHAVDYKRYVGAQIGIYNPKGQKVGKVHHLYNKELIYVLEKNTSN